MLYTGQPFTIDGRGRTLLTDREQWIKGLVEQVLFTSPGERVDRLDFGCGLKQLVFSPNSTQAAVATQALVQGALQRWLGGLIQVDGVDVQIEDATLRATVRYRVLATGQGEVATFERSTP